MPILLKKRERKPRNLGEVEYDYTRTDAAERSPFSATQYIIIYNMATTNETETQGGLGRQLHDDDTKSTGKLHVADSLFYYRDFNLLFFFKMKS